jgi:hypothetical protein
MDDTRKKTMAELTELIIQADKAVTVAKARSDALRAHTLRLLTEQAATDGAAPAWRTTDGTVSLDAWDAEPTVHITDENELVRLLAEVTSADEIDRYANATITVPASYLDEVREAAEGAVGPFGSVQVSRSLTPQGKEWVLSQAAVGIELRRVQQRNAVCVTVDLVDVETGEVLVEDAPGLTPVKARPRLVLRRKGKASEAKAAAEAALEEIANI